MGDDSNICEAMDAIAQLAHRVGATPGNKFENCWERQVDDHWWISMNCHPEARKNSKGIEVPMFSCYVEFNGWPAGIINPFGGIIAAGSLANEDTFIAAVKASGQ